MPGVLLESLAFDEASGDSHARNEAGFGRILCLISFLGDREA